MNEREFCYWLQGLFEVGGLESLDAAKTKVVRDHLALVFNKVTPQYAPPLHDNGLRSSRFC